MVALHPFMALAAKVCFRPIADIRPNCDHQMMDNQLALSRTFDVDGRQVGCRFFQPEQEGGSYFCRYEIDWPEGVRSRRVGGVDEVQAVLLAMQSAHSDFLVAREHDGRLVSFQGRQSLGLPIAKIMRDWDPENEL